MYRYRSRSDSRIVTSVRLPYILLFCESKEMARSSMEENRGGISSSRHYCHKPQKIVLVLHRLLDSFAMVGGEATKAMTSSINSSNRDSPTPLSSKAAATATAKLLPNFLEELEILHESWCWCDVHDERQVTTDDGNGTGNGKASSPLAQARSWLRDHAQHLDDRKQLDSIIKMILKELEVESKLKSDDTNDHHNKSHPQPSLPLLRQIEWQIVMMLELRILCGETKLAERVSKVLSKRRTKQNKKKSRPPQKVLLDFLVQTLSKAAFLLPSDQPFGSFLTKNCLTKQTWHRLPEVSTFLLDFFEVANPYSLAKKEEDMPLHNPSTHRKKKIKTAAAAKQPKSLPKKAPLRRLPLKRKNNVRARHFNANLQDISKMLDHTPKSKNTDALPKNVSKRANRPVITPLTTEKRTQNTKQSKKPQIRQGSFNNNNNNNIESPKKRPRSVSVVVQETPLRKAHKQRILHLSPPPRGVVAETPMTTKTKRGKTFLHGVVAETSAAGERLDFFSLPTPTAVQLGLPPLVPQQQQHPEMVVRPMKLFATFKPRPPSLASKTQQQTTQQQPIPPPKSSIRSASVAAAAARSFLKRKSL
jgi:hypothetical protein